MRLSQFSTADATKNWGVDTSTVADFDHLLAAYGDYVYCQGDSEETIQKRARVDGALVWQKDFNIYGATSQKILVDNQHNIYTLKNKIIYKYNSDGNLVWSYDTEYGFDTIYLKDVMPDGSKIAIGHFKKIIILNSSGAVSLEIDDSDIQWASSVKFDSNGDVLSVVDGPNMLRKYNGTTGAVLWTTTATVPNLFCIDISNNIWTIVSTNLAKIGKNTGNVLVTSVDTPTAKVQEILPVSNGNIAVISYNSGTDVLTIDIRDGNAIQLDSENHANITEYNSAVIAV